jgi:hypothetical protein
MRKMLIIAAALLVVAVPATAVASRSATRAEKAALKKAVKSSKKAPRFARKGNFKLAKVRISSKGPWASAIVLRSSGYTDPFKAPRAVFRHGKSWKLVSYGTKAGCSKPRLGRGLRKDLKLSCR